MEMAMEDVDGGVHEGQAARLSKIRISNFKNYVGDHVIDVARESFVCVFGRNGSGKSCVVDAIAFCLGASTTQLRVKKLASLVNDSVASRDPNAVCSVCVEFSISEQPDLWIKRQVDVKTSATKFLVRDANGDHWKTVSRGVVEDTVKSLGIDMNLQDRFIIRQANATALAQVSSLGLLNFCERVIGTTGLLQEIDELRAKENEALTQCEQIREEVEQLQTERAKSQPMVEKFRKWIYDKERLRDRIQDESAKLAAIDHHLLDLYQCTKRSLCHEIDLRNEEVMSIQKNLAQQQTEQKTHTAHAHKTEELVAKAKQDYSSIVRRRIALETKIKSVQAELTQREVKGQELRREYDSAIRDERDIDNSVGAHRKLLSELQADYKITQLKQVEKLSVTHDKDKHKHEGRLREIAALENALNESIRDKDQKFATFEKAQRALDGTKGIIRQISSRNADRVEILKQKEDELTLLHNKIYELHQLKKTKMQAIRALEDQLQAAQRELCSQVSHSKRIGVIQMLQRKMGTANVRGHIWELASASKEYEEAVNSVLKPQLSYIVVKSRSVALKVANVFDHEEAGRVTCCVQDELCDGFYCNEHAQPPVFGSSSLCSVIKCVDDQARAVFHKYLHSWIVCVDDEQAIRISSKEGKSCATLSGNLFYADGAIRANRICRRGETRSQARICSNFPSVVATTDDIQSSGSVQDMNQLQRELDACQEVDRKLHDQIEEETRRSQYQKSEITQLKRDFEKDEEQRRLADAKLQTAQLKVDMARASLQTIDTTHIEEMSRQLSRMKACQKELSAPFPEITEFKSEIELIKKVTSCERALENAERRALTLRTQRKYLHDQISALDKNQQVSSGSLASLLSSLDSTSNREEACKRVLTDHKNALVVVKEKIFQSQKSSLEITNDLERASSQIAEREAKKKVNDVFIAELQRELLQLSPHLDYAEKRLYEAEDIEATKTLRSQAQVSLGLLKEEETVLERVKATISRHAVEDAMRCQEDIMLKEGKVESLRADILRMNERRDSLITTRFSRLVSTLRDVNDNLGKIYRVLNEDGECYLGYSLEKATFFDEGLVFNCKPDENHWQHFVGLSGGQQVVCSVSLMLAFQASFSCPFYICDEIDAALDTINVSKLGKLLLQQSEKTKTQFLIVSHRPEMWELCSYLVGIYERDHSACVIACHF